MMHKPTTAERLLAHWRTQPGLQLRSPATESALGFFERRYGVTLPPGLREYLLLANGFGAPDDQDQEGFSFWPIERITRLSDYEGGRFGLVENVYTFADYLGWSWAYGLQLGARDGGVCIVGTADNRLLNVAKSFDEFVDLYISDDEKIYVP